ncbi:MAG: hypothetical protein ACREQQ_03040 [Candidatus Binatia bacterium]
MSYAADLRIDRNGSLLLPLALSILFHGLFALLFMVVSLRVPTPESSPFDVEILRPEAARARSEAAVRSAEKSAPPAAEAAIEPPKNQIVSPPDSPEEKPESARLFSDRDSRTLQETVKRGEPAPPAQPPREKPEKAEKSERKTDKLAAKAKGKPEAADRSGDASVSTEQQRAKASGARLPGLGDLYLAPAEVARDPALRKGESGTEAKTELGSSQKYAALDRPELWANPGERGTPDYLPDVRQGSFTLLNTKADRFAPFVRRVALRVFQTFSMEFKQQIYSGSVPQGKENVEIEAVMSRGGKRLEVYLKQRSGNLSTDRVLLGTLTDSIFFDENPPANAVAEDGRIHFLFALNASVWYGHDENGRPQAGAHWIFGAGLL